MANLLGSTGRQVLIKFRDIADIRAIHVAMINADYFLSLTSLKGRWIGAADYGQTLRVQYSLHANASVLMEQGEFRGTDALTLYHLDGEKLMATHYCPLCNQPRLDLIEVEGGCFRFSCVSATNLSNFDVEHQHAFEIELIDQSTFWRSESYMTAGIVTSEAITYTRD